MKIVFKWLPDWMWYYGVATVGNKEISRCMNSRQQFPKFIEDAKKVFKTDEYELVFDKIAPLSKGESKNDGNLHEG